MKHLIILSIIFFSHLSIVFAESDSLSPEIVKLLDPQLSNEIVTSKVVGEDEYFFIKCFDEVSLAYALVAREDGVYSFLALGEKIWPIDKLKIKSEGYEFFLNTLVERELSRYEGGVDELNRILEKFPRAYNDKGEDYINLMISKGVKIRH